MKQISAATNLQKKTDHHLMAIAIVLVLGLVLWFIFYSIASQQLAEIALIRQEIEATHVSDQQLNSLGNLIDANVTTIESMDQFFPTETNIIATFEVIENLIKKYDPQAVINIPSETPTKKNEQLQIPLQIRLTITLESFTRLLREIEKLPLLFQINSLSINHSGTNALQINLGTSLYVDEPFLQPKTDTTN